MVFKVVMRHSGAAVDDYCRDMGGERVDREYGFVVCFAGLVCGRVGEGGVAFCCSGLVGHFEIERNFQWRKVIGPEVEI